MKKSRVQQGSLMNILSKPTPVAEVKPTPAHLDTSGMSKLEALIAELCPNGVRYKQIKNVSDFISGFAFKSNLFREYGSPICKTTNIINGIVDFSSMTFFNENDYNINFQKYVVNPGDIVIGMSGTVKVGINNTDMKCFLNQRVGKFIVKNINKKYLYYFLLNSIKNILKDISGGSVINLSNNDILKLKIPVPPLKVQEEIVRILDTFSELTAELTAELTKRKQQYQYYTNKLFTFNNTTKLINLEDLCGTITTGRLNANAMIENGKYPFFTCDATPYKIDEYAFDTKAIILSGNGSQIGHLNFYSGKFNAYQRTYVLFDFINILPEYLFFYMKANIREYILKIAKKGSVPYITLPMLQNFKVPVPPLADQKRIVSILDRFDTLCNDLTSGLPAEIEARKKQYEYYRDKLLTFKELSA